MLRNRKWLVTAIAVFLLIIADWAWSSFGPCIQGEKQQPYQCSETDYNITQMISYRASVSVVDFIEKRHDLVTAFATVIIALFTITLWRATSGLLASAKEQSRDMKASIAVAKKSADAANRAANVAEMALTDLERPHIFMEVKETNFMWDINGAPVPDQRMIVSPPQLEYSFVNYGRTPAFLVELFERLIPVHGNPERDLPQPIDPRELRGRTLPVGIIVGPDKPYDSRLDYPADSEMKRIRPRGANLFLLGYIRYDDIFGNRNITGFCLVLDYASRRFAPVGDTRYNYTQNERDAFASRAGLSETL